MLKVNKEKQKWVKLREGTKTIPSIYKLPERPLVVGLWCLLISKEYFKVDYLRVKEIEFIIREYLDIGVINTLGLKRAFARVNGRKVIKQDEAYKITYQGKDYVLSYSGSNITILYLAPNKPREAKKSFSELVRSIKKDTLLIIDPYYGIKTLDILEEMAIYHKKLKFLTAQLGGGEQKSKFVTALSDFKREYSAKVEIRIYPTKTDLHDRYIITNDTIFIVGQGIKDLGNKESLIFSINDRYGKGIRKILIKEFFRKWSKSKLL